MKQQLQIADESDTRAPLKSIRLQFKLLDEADALDRLEILRNECLSLSLPLPKPSGDSVADLDRAESHAVRARVAARLSQRAAAQETGRAMSQTAQCQDAHAAAVKPAPAPAAATKPPTPPAVALGVAAKPSQTELCQTAHAARQKPIAPLPAKAEPTLADLKKAVLAK